MRIRWAIDSDAEAIAKIHVASWQKAYRGILPDFYLDSLSVEKRIRIWQSVLSKPDINTCIAETDDEQVVGFANLLSSRDDDANPNTAELGAIYVNPDCWGQGYGHTLLTTILEKAQDRGFCCITLWVLEPNSRARRFYEAMGFIADGVTKTEATKEGVVFDEVRYRLDLKTGQVVSD